jgi:hypothetical protein
MAAMYEAEAKKGIDRMIDNNETTRDRLMSNSIVIDDSRRNL